MKKVCMFIILLAFLLMFLLGCSKRSQSVSSNQIDTVAIDSTSFAAYIEYMHNDTTKIKPTFIEKVGAVALTVFIIHQVTKFKEE